MHAYADHHMQPERILFDTSVARAHVRHDQASNSDVYCMPTLKRECECRQPLRRQSKSKEQGERCKQQDGNPCAWLFRGGRCSNATLKLIFGSGSSVPESCGGLPGKTLKICSREPTAEVHKSPESRRLCVRGAAGLVSSWYVMISGTCVPPV